ncbi:hypothetical protein [Oceanicella actignis]|uniref:hypothetical protein n=1 Tax=Oceanicella actignis TaxID=1189325 RepID=UPI0011E86F32|nr:hypothetical protein [Oceanicella actignis]TYO85057.1 hypothetical protein LY05_02771 [Oceanicella actignis]
MNTHDMAAAGRRLRDRPLEALRNARALYRQLSEIMAAEIRALGAGLAALPDDDRLRKLVELHNKTLSQLMEFEARVEKQIAERIGRGRGELDLGAARREILGKLARLKAALGAGADSGAAQPECAAGA